MKVGTKIFTLSWCIFLIPFLVWAADLNKGLSDPANQGEIQSFLKNGATLSISPPTAYPVPGFMLDAGRSINFRVGADKEQYQAGEEMRINVSAQSHSFLKNTTNMPRPTEIFYLWAAGNFDVEIYRLSDEVKLGEILVASGKVYRGDTITLLQNEQKQFSFSWPIPADARNGTYEIRIYPTSDGALFRGSPEVYRSSTKTRFFVSNDGDKEEKITWNLDQIKINGESFHQKEKVIYFNSGEKNAISIPLRNSGESEERRMVIKKIIAYAPEYGMAVSQEQEEINLAPGAEKVINYNLDNSNIKGEPGALAEFIMVNQGKREMKNQNYFDFPLDSSFSEAVFAPFSVQGNTQYSIGGVGINTVKDSPGFAKGSFLTPFMEVRRSDPIFYYSAEIDRAAEDNLKLVLTLFDRSGKKVDEIGYEGPSWDRTGTIWKIVQLKKDYDYLKIAGVLSSQSKGEIQKQELEYFAPLPTVSWWGKLKAILADYWTAVTVGGTAILAVLALFTVWKLKNRL